tara:strand:+ start:37 stop:147 length:111 start_codon:yes stop_codon:yes gene_type:complete
MKKYYEVFVSLNELELEELKQIKKDIDEFIKDKEET